MLFRSTFQKGSEEVYYEVLKNHNVTKKLVTEICSEAYYKAPPGVSQDGYKGSFGSIMGWCLAGSGAKDRLVDKVIRRITGESEPVQKPLGKNV